MQFVIYSKNKKYLNIDDLTSANIRCALVTKGYNPNTTEYGNSTWSDVSSDEISSSGGYAAAELTGETETVTRGWKWKTEDASWEAVGGNIDGFAYAVFYYNGTLWGLTNPLIGVVDCGDTAETTDGKSVTVGCPYGGWFDVV